MIMILQLSAIIIVTACASTFTSAAATTSPTIDTSINTEIEKPQLSLVERMKAITPVNYKKWSIRGGCINSSRIKRIKFLDDRTALLSLVGKKKAVLRLASNCPGIKRHGFSHASDGQRICTRYSRFSVLGGSYACKVASIDPYLELEDPPELKEFE